MTKSVESDPSTNFIESDPSTNFIGSDPSTNFIGSDPSTDFFNSDPSANFVEGIADGKDKEASRFIKVVVILCTILLSAGSHFANNALSTLKSDIKHNLDINNAQYGSAQAALYVINTFMPLVGGILMDIFGTVPGAFISTSAILLGTIMEALALTLGSFPLLIVGRVLHGTGSGTIMVAQETILGLWFSDSIIGTVIGLQVGITNLASFISQGVVASFGKATGFYASGIWLAVGVCALSWAMNFLYALIVRTSGRKLLMKSKKRPSAKRLLYLPPGFWIMPLNIFLLGAVWTPFIGSVTEIVRTKFGSTSVVAAWTGSVSLLVPVFLSPIFGGAVDKFGHRSINLLACTLLNTLSLVLIGYTMISPLVGLIFFSISLTIGPVILMSTITILLPPDMIGTGIGAHKVALSIGEAISHLIVGRIQDLTPNQAYDGVFLFLLCVSILAILSSFLYIYYNRFKVHNLFDVPCNKRGEILSQHSETISATKSHSELSSNSKPHKLFVSVLAGMAVVSWCLFIWTLAQPAS